MPVQLYAPADRCNVRVNLPIAGPEVGFVHYGSKAGFYARTS